MIDVSKIQPGDKFTVELTARAPVGVLPSAYGPCTLVQGNETHILFEEVSILANKIVGHTPKPREIAIGDDIVFVSGTPDKCVKTVVAIFEGQVAYKYVVDGKTYYTSRPLELMEHRK